MRELTTESRMFNITRQQRWLLLGALVAFLAILAGRAWRTLHAAAEVVHNQNP
jgi:hypothetical protein